MYEGEQALPLGARLPGRPAARPPATRTCSATHSSPGCSSWPGLKDRVWCVRGTGERVAGGHMARSSRSANASECPLTGTV